MSPTNTKSPPSLHIGEKAGFGVSRRFAGSTNSDAEPDPAEGAGAR
jgi:hypothetical protein